MKASIVLAAVRATTATVSSVSEQRLKDQFMLRVRGIRRSDRDGLSWACWMCTYRGILNEDWWVWGQWLGGARAESESLSRKGVIRQGVGCLTDRGQRLGKDRGKSVSWMWRNLMGVFPFFFDREAALKHLRKLCLTSSYSFLGFKDSIDSYPIFPQSNS